MDGRSSFLDQLSLWVIAGGKHRVLLLLLTQEARLSFLLVVTLSFCIFFIDIFIYAFLLATVGLLVLLNLNFSFLNITTRNSSAFFEKIIIIMDLSVLLVINDDHNMN
jgi:hypothetical protein